MKRIDIEIEGYEPQRGYRHLKLVKLAHAFSDFFCEAEIDCARHSELNLVTDDLRSHDRHVRNLCLGAATLMRAALDVLSHMDASDVRRALDDVLAMDELEFYEHGAGL